MTLLERHPLAPSAWQGTLPVTNRYTLGLAGERFFRGIKENGRLLGTRCRRCDHIYVPAATFCERCLDELDEWIDVGTVGEVYTYTLLYTNYEGFQEPNPQIIAFIRFGDGGLIHKLAFVEPDDVSIGMHVTAVFRPVAEREGSILDIAYFKPVN